LAELLGDFRGRHRERSEAIQGPEEGTFPFQVLLSRLWIASLRSQ
jgi:hypothetical protein